MWYINFADRLITIDDFARRQKIVVGRLPHDLARKMTHEFEDPRVRPLMLAECLVIDEEVANVSMAIDLRDPAGKFLSCERPLFPAPI